MLQNLFASSYCGHPCGRLRGTGSGGQMMDGMNTGLDSLRKRDTGVTVLPGHRSEPSSHET